MPCSNKPIIIQNIKLKIQIVLFIIKAMRIIILLIRSNYELFVFIAPYLKSHSSSSKDTKIYVSYLSRNMKLRGPPFFNEMKEHKFTSAREKCRA
jgi:hypothetical protein